MQLTTPPKEQKFQLTQLLIKASSIFQLLTKELVFQKVMLIEFSNVSIEWTLLVHAKPAAQASIRLSPKFRDGRGDRGALIDQSG